MEVSEVGSFVGGKSVVAKSWSLALLLLLLTWCVGFPQILKAETVKGSMTSEKALQLGEEFGVVVGEVDEGD